MLFGHPAAMALRLERPGFAVEFAATLLTGFAGVVAAFHLALLDRSRLWALLPAGPGLVWLSCCMARRRSWIVEAPHIADFGEAARWVLLIAATSLPIGGVLLWWLAPARPLRPGLAGAAGGLGAVALSACVLQFFHPAMRL
jgi:hypothetical protein